MQKCTSTEPWISDCVRWAVVWVGETVRLWRFAIIRSIFIVICCKRKKKNDIAALKYSRLSSIRPTQRINFEVLEVFFDFSAVGGWPGAVPCSFLYVIFVQMLEHRGSVNVGIISEFVRVNFAEVSPLAFFIWHATRVLCKFRTRREYFRRWFFVVKNSSHLILLCFLRSK